MYTATRQVQSNSVVANTEYPNAWSKFYSRGDRGVHNWKKSLCNLNLQQRRRPNVGRLYQFKESGGAGAPKEIKGYQKKTPAARYGLVERRVEICKTSPGNWFSTVTMSRFVNTVNNLWDKTQHEQTGEEEIACASARVRQRGQLTS